MLDCSFSFFPPFLHPAVTEMASLRAENQRLKSLRNCKICLSSHIQILFLPCRHLVCCEKCSGCLRHCPICRREILGEVRTFMAWETLLCVIISSIFIIISNKLLGWKRRKNTSANDEYCYLAIIPEAMLLHGSVANKELFFFLSSVINEMVAYSTADDAMSAR